MASVGSTHWSDIVGRGGGGARVPMHAGVRRTPAVWRARPSQLFLSTPLSMAFVNLKPLVPGHVSAPPAAAARRCFPWRGPYWPLFVPPPPCDFSTGAALQPGRGRAARRGGARLPSLKKKGPTTRCSLESNVALRAQVLVSPRRVVPKMLELTPSEHEDLWRTVRHVAQAVQVRQSSLVSRASLLSTSFIPSACSCGRLTTRRGFTSSHARTVRSARA